MIINNKTIYKSIIFISCILIGVFVLGPFYWLFLISIKSPIELLEVPPTWIPKQLYLKNYVTICGDIFGAGKIFGVTIAPGAGQSIIVALLNSTIVAISATLICLIFSSLAAYTFSRFNFRYKNALFLAYMMTRMLPGLILVIPLFLMARVFGLSNNRFVLAVIYVAITLPFAILLLKNYFDQIPYDLEEAALIDGCSKIGALRKILLPLAMPGLVATSIIVFMMTWGEFFLALILMSDETKLTIPIVVARFALETSTIDKGLISASGIIATFPPVILALIFQRYIIQGLLSGGIKG